VQYYLFNPSFIGQALVELSEDIKEYKTKKILFYSDNHVMTLKIKNRKNDGLII